ncbi:MAG TPA: HesA/MoeB/ThiF family protein [Myxococcales bacterium]|nr:HesA/MoeB/ThiF family protein [Myxococcales bacterium]
MTTALILGVGGLGCPAALALAEELPGVRLVLVDPDRVERSNLARQILFTENDVGDTKAIVAARRLAALVPDVRAEPRVAAFRSGTAAELLAGCDVVLDGTDDFETRFLVNDAACAARIPLVHGAVLGWRGQILTVSPRRGPCLRCLFEGPPPAGAVPTCAEAGVLAPLCGVVGAAMAAEAARLLRGERPHWSGRLKQWDALHDKEREIRVPQRADCPACGLAPSGALRHL